MHLFKLVPDKSVNVTTIKTAWSGNSLNISWEPLTLHEARGFPVYYLYLNDSSGTVKREIEPTANTTESNIVIDGLDSSQTYMLAILVATDSGNNLGDVSETGTYVSCKCKQISHLDLLRCLKK